jgi:plasmid stabilization system protein ParE
LQVPQVAYFKSLRDSLAERFHLAVKSAALKACAKPARFPIEHSPAIRRVLVQGFPYLIFRELSGTIQILALAHQRRRPHYWLGRI